jgi:uncharacterized protein
VSQLAVTFAVRVRPGMARTRVGGRFSGPLGDALVVAVSAPAVDGRATEAALRATAEALGIRRDTLQLRTGRNSRNKLFVVTNPPDDLDQRLNALRESRG